MAVEVAVWCLEIEEGMDLEAAAWPRVCAGTSRQLSPSSELLTKVRVSPSAGHRRTGGDWGGGRGLGVGGGQLEETGVLWFSKTET